MGWGLALVVAIAVGVGVLVYRLTATSAMSPSPVDDPGAAETTPEDDAGAWAGGEVGVGSEGEALEGYIRVGASTTSWHNRLSGAMGLVIAVGVGTIVLALALWGLVSLIARLMSDPAAPIA